jgi:hypothetical protein
MTNKIKRLVEKIFHRDDEDQFETIIPEKFPLLTIEMLDELVHRLSHRVTNAEDCLIIDHYLKSIGLEGHLEEALWKEGLSSFEEVPSVFRTFNHRAFTGVVSTILENIIYLSKRVTRGEKIY